MDSRTAANFGKCRCCLAEGYHKDLMKEHSFGGIRGAYFDIFMDCFNLFLSPDAQITKLICTSCAHKLQEASTFRAMVVATERQLMESLKHSDNKEMVFVNVPTEDMERITTDCDIKMEEDGSLKDELSDLDLDTLDRDDYDHDFDSAPVHDSSYQEDVEFERKQSKLLSRFPPGELPTRQTLHKLCPEYVKHLKLLKGLVILPSTIAKLLEGDQRRPNLCHKKKFITEKMAHIINASTLLECSNITPFRSRSRNGFPCFYCRNLFDSLDKLKEHTVIHKKVEMKKVLSTYGAECLVVYADVTDLSCTLCEKTMPNLNELKTHLIREHKKKLYPEFSDRVIPFKLTTSNVYECQICGFNFETFGSIERHMNVHFRNYVCRECGTGFVTKYRLKVHVKSMHIGGIFPCDVCKKVFTTQQKQKNHVDTVHKMVKRFKCTKCPERFSEYFRRQKHLVEAHGVAPLKYKCNVCDKSFDRRYTLSRHMKRDHLEERDFQCNLCPYKCFTKNELRVHMIKHNGERIFECSVCKKSYARKKTLKEHMRIHNNDRRFACTVCGQAFVQKCSLKGHLKTHHHEYGLQ